MKNQRAVRNTRANRMWLLAVLVTAIELLLLAALPLSAQVKMNVSASGSGDSIGFIASKNPDTREVGLPLYPGARPHQNKSDDSPKFQLGLWGGAWGLKLVVLKLESNDPPEKVSAFYHKALAKYDKVWNCADSPKVAGAQEKTASADEPNCQDEHAESGETLLQAGT